MKNILVVYYTQTGQLRRIVDSVLAPLMQKEDCNIDYLQIKPAIEYPFPWKDKFFNDFAECVNGVPCELQPITLRPDVNYDLIVLGYQPWFLSPSIPFWSFLVSDTAKHLLQGKKVITIIGARNMWGGAQELIKKQLKTIKASLVGNIALCDKHDNLVSAVTIIRWLVHGRKEPGTLFPEAGVTQDTIDQASAYGDTIYRYLVSKTSDLQSGLVKQGSVIVKFNLLKIEITARKIFCKFASLAIKREKKSRKKKMAVVALFKYYVLFALFLLSPIASLVFTVFGILLFPIARKTKKYYQGVELK